MEKDIQSRITQYRSRYTSTRNDNRESLVHDYHGEYNVIEDEHEGRNKTTTQEEPGKPKKKDKQEIQTATSSPESLVPRNSREPTL
jgi:hypothetical protein